MLPIRVSTATALLALAPAALFTADLPRVRNVERQPLAAQAKRLAEALEYLGNPLPAADKAAVAASATEADETKAIGLIQDALDKHCLAAVAIEKAVGVSGR